MAGFPERVAHWRHRAIAAPDLSTLDNLLVTAQAAALHRPALTGLDIARRPRRNSPR
ncbi:hypothetical protein [Streptomyces sp. NPDC046870]|uniref:hypothetical protein n=1 Tax=Streptomyces sp. NPDC046870 TaxID=3155135 RepID=UPI0034550AF6